MSDQDETIPIGDFSMEITRQIVDELGRRMDLEGLSDRDNLAVLTAIGKAAYLGILRGVALYEHEARTQAPGVELSAWLSSEGVVDVWEETYGDSDGS